jgi:GxxExxY protein
MTENEIAKIIVGASIEAHRELGGPGLLEDVYEEALAEELRLRGLQVDRQLPVRIHYKGRVLSKPLRLDLKVEKLVLVDNKAVTEWNPVFEAQMLTYLRLTQLKLGLVINFGEQYVKNGAYRVVNGLPDAGISNRSRNRKIWQQVTMKTVMHQCQNAKLPGRQNRNGFSLRRCAFVSLR